MVAPNPSTFTNTRIPQSEFLDPLTKRPSREWLFWLQNPDFVNASLNVGLSPSSGGTGTSTIPTNGQLLIGNSTTNAYTVADLGTGAGISKTIGAGSLSIANTGVLSFSADSTGLTPATATTGNVVLGGVLNETHGGTNQSSYVTGDLLYASATNTLSKLADVATGNALISGGVATAPSWGKIGLTTHVTGTLPVGNGGSGATTLTGYLKGNGASPFTAVSSIPYTDVSGLGTIVTQNLGATGSFTAQSGETVTVVNGIITSIV